VQPSGYLVDWIVVQGTAGFNPVWLSTGINPPVYDRPPAARVPVFTGPTPIGCVAQWITMAGVCAFEFAAGGRLSPSATAYLPVPLASALVGLGVASIASPPFTQRAPRWPGDTWGPVPSIAELQQAALPSAGPQPSDRPATQRGRR
jgi:hypothetical protein